MAFCSPFQAAGMAAVDDGTSSDGVSTGSADTSRSARVWQRFENGSPGSNGCKGKIFHKNTGRLIRLSTFKMMRRYVLPPADPWLPVTGPVRRMAGRRSVQRG